MAATEPPAPEILLAHAGWVRALARSLAVDASAADDLVQDTWLAALRQGPSEERPLGRWLTVALRNFAGKAQRSRARRAARESRAARDERLPATAELCERAEGHRELVASVLALPEPSRTAILLRFFEELPPRVIAARLELPVRTVNSRIARGLAYLRADLEDEQRGAARALVVALVPAGRAGGAGLGLGLVLANAKLALGIALAVVVAVAVGTWQLGRGARPPRPETPGASLEIARVAEKPEASRPREHEARTAVAEAPSNVPALQQHDPNFARPGRLSGIVVDARERPLAGITVEVQFRAEATFPELEASLVEDGRDVGSVVTDQDGHFELQVERGRPYDVLAHAPPGSALASAREQERYCGETVKLVLLPAAAIEGDVTRLPDKSPVAGALVRVTHDYDEAEVETRTDVSGHFFVGGLVPGAIGFQVVPDVECPPPWTDLAVEAGLTLRHDVGLAAGLVAAGRVLDARTGAPIADAEVTSWSFLFKNVRTDAAGRYAISGLRADRPVTLAARAAGYGRSERRFDPSAADAMDFALVPGRSARGRVVDAHGAPLEGVHVLARAIEMRETGQAEDARAARSGPDGTFELADLRLDVAYACVARKEGCATLLVPAAIPAGGAGALDLGELVLALPAGIAGRVVDERGEPIPSTWMGLSSASEHLNAWLVRRELRTAADGSFVCTDLDAGRWRVRLAPRGQAVLERDVELEAGVVLQLDLVIAAGYSLGGRVVDPDGNPVADVEMGLSAEHPEGLQGAWRDSTDADGRFEFEGLESGPHTLTAHPFGPWRGDVELAPARLTGLLPGTVPVEVVLHPIDRVVAGRVLAHDGSPIEKAAVFEPPGRNGVLTDAEGRFELRVPSGAPLELCAVRTTDIATASGTLMRLEIVLGRAFVQEPRACATGIEPGRKDVELRFPR